MTFTINNFAGELAAHLKKRMPEVTFYEDPSQQGLQTPGCFLQQRLAKITKKQAGRYLRTISLDLTYLEDFNLSDMQERYQKAAEIMDESLELIPYGDAQLRTYDRNWNIDLDELHYKFELRVWVSPEEDVVLMQSLDYRENVSDAGKV